MRVVILAGGFGTRISEESHLKPKPMIEIGGQPILWHIMKLYSHYGYNDFVICVGYKQHIIKNYFAQYYLHQSDVTFDFASNNSMQIHNNFSEPWRVTVVDTGLDTMTGGRVKRVREYLGGETFMLTYGDGVSDVDINELYSFHRSHGKIATITTINLSHRFGLLIVDDDGRVASFKEKSHSEGDVINGGFMVLEPEVFDYLDGDETVLEREPMERLVDDGQLMAYQHEGFWQCMDTQRDKQLLDELYRTEKAPWKVW